MPRGVIKSRRRRRVALKGAILQLLSVPPAQNANERVFHNFLLPTWTGVTFGRSLLMLRRVLGEIALHMVMVSAGGVVLAKKGVGDIPLSATLHQCLLLPRSWRRLLAFLTQLPWVYSFKILRNPRQDTRASSEGLTPCKGSKV